MNDLPSPLERRIAALESRVAKLVEKLDRKGPQPVKSESDAPEGYRRLENGEIIHSGDVWQREFSGPVSVSPQLVGMRYSGLACLPLLRPIAQDPEPIAKPRRSPVEILRGRLAKYVPSSFQAGALKIAIEELQQEGYE